MDPSILNAILSDITVLRKVIAYHVVESTLPAALFKNELTPLSASGENLRVNVYDSGDAKVSSKSITGISGLKLIWNLMADGDYQRSVKDKDFRSNQRDHPRNQ